MSIRSYIKSTLPAQYFDNNIQWLSRLTQIITMPFDVIMTALEYIPNLINMKDHLVPLDGLINIGKSRSMPKYDIESTISYNDRLYNAWELWQNAGSRYGVYANLYMAGYHLDLLVPVRNNYYYSLYGDDLSRIQTQDPLEISDYYRYGIEEKVISIEAYWPNLNNPNENNAMCWGYFSWGGFINTKFNTNIYVSDPNNEYMFNQTRANEIVDIFYRFAPGHISLYNIYFTNGEGSIFTKYNIKSKSWGI